MHGMFLLFLVYVSCLRSYCVGQGAPPPSGDNYVLSLETSIYACDEPSIEVIDPTGIEAERINETVVVLNGPIWFRRDIIPGYMVEIKIEKVNQGRLDLVSSMQICDICDELEDPESQYIKYLLGFGFPQKCPAEAGEYHVTDMIADFSDMPINSSNQGSYKATLTVNKDKDGSCKEFDYVACVGFDFIIDRA